MKPPIGAKIMCWDGLERTVESHTVASPEVYDFVAGYYFREGDEGFNWIYPADDLEAFAAMLAVRAMT